MKITTIIAPFILYASLAEGAKKKKPKAPKNGSGSEETETVTEEAAQETARDVGEVISSFYPTQVPTVAPAISTTLASTLLALESSWLSSPDQTSVDAAIMSAAPLATSLAFAATGYAYADVMTQSWYSTGVPKSLQTEVSNYVNAIESAHNRYVGVAAAATGSSGSSSSSSVSGGFMTKAPVLIAAVVGAAGVFAVALL